MESSFHSYLNFPRDLFLSTHYLTLSLSLSELFFHGLSFCLFLFLQITSLNLSLLFCSLSPTFSLTVSQQGRVSLCVSFSFLLSTLSFSSVFSAWLIPLSANRSPSLSVLWPPSLVFNWKSSLSLLFEPCPLLPPPPLFLLLSVWPLFITFNADSIICSSLSLPSFTNSLLFSLAPN